MTDEVARLVRRTHCRTRRWLLCRRVRPTWHVHTRLPAQTGAGRPLAAQARVPARRRGDRGPAVGGGAGSPGQVADAVSPTPRSCGRGVAPTTLIRTPCRWSTSHTAARALPRRHPQSVRREIITTVVVNENGPTGAVDVSPRSGADAPEMARAYLLVRWSLRPAGTGRRLRPSTTRSTLTAAVTMCRQAASWSTVRPLADLVTAPSTRTSTPTRPGSERRPGDCPAAVRNAAGATCRLSRSAGTPSWPRACPRRPNRFRRPPTTFDPRVSEETCWSLREVAEVYFDLADQLQLTRLRERIIAARDTAGHDGARRGARRRRRPSSERDHPARPGAAGLEPATGPSRTAPRCGGPRSRRSGTVLIDPVAGYVSSI